jgi:hypothetical protein
MSLRKPLSLVALLAAAALTACSDITGPQQPSGWCPITGSSGTCEGGVTAPK